MIRKVKVTAKQIQNLDRQAIDRVGVPSIALMENAGRSVALEAAALLKRRKQRTVVVLCGLGNNAGDGFVVARHLINHGFKPKVYLIGVPQQLKADARINYQILRNVRYPVTAVKRLSVSVSRDLSKAGVIVDAVFGVGLNREIKAPFKDFIEAINAAKAKVVAVDVPSGLNATTGEIYGVCVKAAVTVTFSFPKTGFFIRKGKKHCGRVVVVDIGIPKQLMDKV